MTEGIILLVLAVLLIGAILYGTFCWVPGNESRKEEKETVKKMNLEENLNE